MMIKGRKISMAVSIMIFVAALFTLGCDKGGGSSNPVANVGSGGISGAVYQDSNVQLSSTGRIESIWLAFNHGVRGFFRIPEAQASTRLNLYSSSPSSGILVELLLNGTLVNSTTTGPNGKFEFGGLAGGEYILRFTKDPDLLIETTVNVKEGAITEIEGKITVASTSGNIHLMMEIEKKRTVDHYYEYEKKESKKKKNKDSNKIEIKGTVISLSPLIVNSGGILYTVNTDSNTKIEGTLSVGVTVEVEGTLTGTNTILAKEVEVGKSKTESDKKKKDDDD